MHPILRTLTLTAALGLTARAAQAQASVLGAPADTVIGVQFEVLPFSLTERPPAPPAPTLVFGAPITALRCPMPVARGNTTGDQKIEVRPSGAATPMPTAAPGCTNPLDPSWGGIRYLVY